MPSPSLESLPSRELPGLPALHPELGALVFTRDSPLPRRISWGLLLAALPGFLVSPVAALGLVLVAMVIPRLGTGPVSVYEKGLATRRGPVSWERCRGLALATHGKGARFDVWAPEGRLCLPLSGPEGEALRGWLEDEVMPRRAQERLRDVLHGLRWKPEEDATLALDRRGLTGSGGERLSWEEYSGCRVSGESLEVLGPDGVAFRIPRSSRGALLLRAMLERAELLTLQLVDQEETPLTAEQVERLAHLGVAGAQVELGRRFLVGDGIVEDAARAKDWFRRAARDGSAEGAAELGVWFRDRARVRYDLEQAASWLRRGAEGGDVGAQAALGLAYRRGEGVDASDPRASEWFRKAAEGGLAEDEAGAERSAAEAAFEGRAAVLGADRPLEGHPETHPELGAFLLAQPDPDLGDPFSAYEGGVLVHDGHLDLSAYVVLRTSSEPGAEGIPDTHRVRLEDGERVIELEADGPPGAFYRVAFESRVAGAIAGRVLEELEAGKPLHFGADLQVTLDRDGISEEVSGGEDERVAWAEVEGVTLLRERLHVMARKPRGATRAVVSMGLDEPSAWVVRAAAERLARGAGGEDPGA